MSGLQGIMKGGWHPKGKDGGRESWRGDFKGVNQVAGWMGKGKQSEAEAAREHVSRPLATLKDPSAFGPPPKNVNYHGGAALPNEITPHRSGLGAPLSSAQTDNTQKAPTYAQVQEEEEPSKPPPPALPYRADRTGLRTDNLPPPPVHRNLHNAAATHSPSQSPAPTAQPRLPPRLPSRQNTVSPPVAEPAPPSYDSTVPKPTTNTYINSNAASNLARTGVSVPALGIGKQNDSNPWRSERSQSQTSGVNQFSQLQSRFGKLNTSQQETGSTSPQSAQTESPSQSAMPSWKQSQSAFTTAQNLRNNPQSVSMADAQSAAQTAGQAQRSASAFREKHADKIATAQTKAKTWDQKYKVTSKLNKYLDEQEQQQAAPQQPNGQAYAQTSQPASAYGATPVAAPSPIQSPSPTVQLPPPIEPVASPSLARKPPPPPAPRKPAKLQAPPPVPTGTKPSLG